MFAVGCRTWATSSIIVLLLAGCGGGGGGGGTTVTVPPTATTPTRPADPPWTSGVFDAPSAFAARCAVPRTGTDPTTGRAYPDMLGSTIWENHWLRAWSKAYYLWYRELPDLNPAAYGSTESYFDLLKTSATTASGAAKDRFHFTYLTSDWVALSQSGIAVGYGAEWALLQSRPPRRLLIAYVEPGSPAALAGLRRGTEVLTADGVDLVNDNTQAGVDTLNAALFPSTAGAHTFDVRDVGSTLTRRISMTAAPVTSTPVQNVRTYTSGTGVVGYLLFNDHIATAERQLVEAFTQLQSASVADLVIDLRYNGGGYLDIASEVAFMIAGPGHTTGKAFERLAFNDKYPSTNPITGAAITPTPFHPTARGFSVSTGSALPTLNLARVFVLTGPGTCSASESIINGLRGAGVEVIQIGSATCGKPHGFYPQDNCGTTYFTIQFAGVNEQGFGDYSDGFRPQNTTGAGDARLPGCSVADDFTRELGDPLEARLAAALAYRQTRSCPAPSGTDEPRALEMTGSDAVALSKPEIRMNRILGRMP
ncbi:MAG: peptidase [Gammaproteobacteria bacterium]|nr:peptidase [Gammaproteobacteria bacterium]